MSTGMRYITIPDPESVVDGWQNPQTGEVLVRGMKAYTYFDLLDEEVWPRPEWRKDELHAHVYNRVYGAHKMAKAQGLHVIAMLETDYAIFAPFATLQGKTFKGPNVDAINRLTQAVTFASSDKPKNFVEVLARSAVAPPNGAGKEPPELFDQESGGEHPPLEPS